MFPQHIFSKLQFWACYLFLSFFYLKECLNPCCNASTCTLKGDAVCAHGQCCQDCQVHQAVTFFCCCRFGLKLLDCFPAKFVWAWICFSVFDFSSNQQGLRVVNPATPAICPSFALAAAPTAPPTFTSMMATPATAWRDTATTAYARRTSSNASHYGAKVRKRHPCGWFGYRRRLLMVCYCVLQEPSRLQASALKGSTRREILTATVARIQKAPSPNVKCGKSRGHHRNWWMHFSVGCNQLITDCADS